MGDRLMIAAMQLAALNGNHEYKMARHDRYQWALDEADALLAAAGEADGFDDADVTATMATLRQGAEGYKEQVEFLKSKLSACERERDALKHRLEPLTEDEAIELNKATSMLDLTAEFFHAAIAAADRIRARRA